MSWRGERRGRVRGAAVLELALTLPLFVTLLLFGMYLSELVRTKLRLQQAGRFLAWELTAHPLSDYGRGDPAGAFAAARREAVNEVLRRYRDLDPAEEGAPRGFGVRYEDFQADVTNEVAPLLEAGAPEVQGDGGPWSARAVALARRGVRASLRGWGFDVRGQVRAEVSTELRSTLLPAHFLEGVGGFFREPMWSTRLGGLRLRGGLVLLADGWALPDGADATVAGGRAGNHRSGETPSGLYLQVRRMRFWGTEDFIDPEARFLLGVRGVVPFELPALAGAFAVSHAYGLTPPRGRSCAGIPGYPAAARSGLVSQAGLLDGPRPQCFDTAPFRDTQQYASSRYLRLFQARGPWFMGCHRAGADDPSSPRRRDEGDRNVLGVDCEVTP